MKIRRSTLGRHVGAEIARLLEGHKVKTDRKRPRLAGRVSVRDHTRGSPLANTTLVAYGDFASPACFQTYRTVKTIQKKMGTTLRYVYRSFPQPEQFRHSDEAAEAAECASAQGKFWEMHDSIFESQEGAGEAQLSRRASEAGLDLLRFRREMRAHAHSGRVRSTRDGGVRSGVAEAPAFFINSIRYESSFGLATLLAALQAVSGGEALRIEGKVPADRKSRRKRQRAKGGSPC
jgi:protein-disulfide isomerase